ncbi:hypothetical protein [Burkholderia ubonensis]|uniref:hypothetical protein n=1 Tax=Burkholderia ubonensis TaxID=101571 RepID=UPI000A737CC0|nr:hypothetical protein [Burkholderia ubonensis]
MEMNTGALSLASSARLNQLFAPAATIYSKNILFVAGPTLNAIEMRSKFALSRRIGIANRRVVVGPDQSSSTLADR